MYLYLRLIDKRSHVVAAGLIGACGVLAAALLHVLVSALGATITGETLPTSYAHILVMPLLLTGAFGSIATSVMIALRVRTSTERRELVRAAARYITRRSVMEMALLIAAVAIATLTLGEIIEQVASFQSLDPWPVLALGSAPFCALLMIVAFAIAGYLRFVLYACILAVAFVAAVFGAFLSATALLAHPRRRTLGDVPQHVHLLVSNVASWRGPPRPSSAI